MPNTKISVLLVVKNAIPLVKGTLDSRRQTFRDFEVIVADGVSTDGTLEVLREAANELPLRIVSEPDRSLAEALAKGLRRATGGIVGMLCADERYYPNTLEQVFKWFEADPNAIVCSGKVDFIDEHDRGMDRYLTAPFNLPAHLACELVPSILSSFFNRPLIGEDFITMRRCRPVPITSFGLGSAFAFRRRRSSATTSASRRPTARAIQCRSALRASRNFAAISSLT